MSTNSYRTFKTVNSIDPRLEAMRYGQKQLEWAVSKGAMMTNWIKKQADSYSTAGFSATFNTQSTSALLDRLVFIEMQFQCTFTGTCTTPGQTLLNADNDAPRSFPIHRVTSNAQVTVDSVNFSSEAFHVLEAIQDYGLSFDMKEMDLSQCPSMLDSHQRYADAIGGIKNALSQFDNNSYSTPRGAFYLDSIVNPAYDGVTQPTAVVKFTVVEPILVSPFLQSSRFRESALTYAQNMSINYVFDSAQLQRIWSHNDVAGVSGTAVSVQVGQGVTNPPKIHLCYLTAPILDSISQEPSLPSYGFNKFNSYLSPQSTPIAPNASQTIVVNNIQVGKVPKSIYIWATRLDSSKNFKTTDSYLPITAVTVLYNNITQFSTADQHDLYALCLKNGYRRSYPEFRGLTQDYTSGAKEGLVGGVIKISGEDLALPDNLAVGCVDNDQLQITVTIQNVNQVESITPVIKVLLVNEGVLTLSKDGTTVANENVLTSDEVLRTRREEKWISDDKTRMMFGGNIFDRTRSLMAKLFSKDNERKLNKGLDELADVYEQLGGKDAKKKIGLARKINEKLGLGLVGGADLSKRDLKSLMDLYD